MKKIHIVWSALVLLSVCVLFCGVPAQAGGGETVKPGIYAGHISLSGMTKEEAARTVESFVEGLRATPITLLAADREVAVTAGELGLAWANRELVDDALKIGTYGNVIKRYKAKKDLEHDNLVYPIRLSLDLQKVSDFLTNQCARYDTKVSNMSLTRKNGEFQILEGSCGCRLDVETSIDRINDYLTGDWDYQSCVIALDVKVEEPKGSAEELARVTDLLGSFTTSFSDSNYGRKANIENGCQMVDGAVLYPGEEFSTYQAVAPFSESNGYYMAGSYLNGRLVDSLGGGICQVSTTLYNAVLRAELDVTMRYNHSMTVTYVELSTDAAIAESAGKDFKFVNNLEHPIYIEGYTENNQITFNIYGVETRPPNREVRYESEVVEVLNPAADNIQANKAMPIGYIVSEGAHIGYKTRLWKVVLEDGREVSRTRVNSSSYKMVPKSVTVGTATSDAAVYNQMMEAIGTGSIDQVKNVIARLTDSAKTGEKTAR